MKDSKDEAQRVLCTATVEEASVTVIVHEPTLLRDHAIRSVRLVKHPRLNLRTTYGVDRDGFDFVVDAVLRPLDVLTSRAVTLLKQEIDALDPELAWVVNWERTGDVTKIVVEFSAGTRPGTRLIVAGTIMDVLHLALPHAELALRVNPSPVRGYAALT